MIEFINKYFCKIFINFHKTALTIAIEKANIEIIKLLLTNNKLDVNVPYIPIYI